MAKKEFAMKILNLSSPFESVLSKERLVLLLFVGMLALLPVYVFHSGGVNLADGPMLLIMSYILLTHRKSEMLMQNNTLIPLSAFLFWAVWVNMINFLISNPVLCVIASLQIIYTVLMFVTLTIFFHRTLKDVRAVKFIYLAVLLCTIMPLLTTGLSIGFRSRQGLSFPNPNQLAYFAQIILAAVLILNNNANIFHPEIKASKFIRLTTVVVFVFSHYYVLLSASRAGLVGVACLDLLALWKKKKLFLTAFISLVIIFPAMIFMSSDNFSGMKIYKRMMAGGYYSGLAERTEGRFNFEDLSLVFGGGKANRSMEDEKKAREFKEVHNTFADIVYSYGMIGGGLFVSFIFFYFRTCSAVIFNLFALLSFLPFHLTHNMIRFRLMWIFYALVYGTCLLYHHSIDFKSHTQRNAQRESTAINLDCVASGR